MSGHTTDDDAVAGSSVVHELDQQEVYLTVADGLERLVLNGTLKPGAKLPGERELCDQLGVSRPALREGLHILRERGLVYAMKGKGNFVSPANWEALRRSFALFSHRSVTCVNEILELRRFIEVPSAGLAALRRRSANIAALQRLVDQMAYNLPSLVDGLTADPVLALHSDTVERHIQLDIQFHVAVGEAAQNPLIPPILDSLTGLLRKFMYLDLRRSGGNIVALTFHRRIYDCIAAGDPRGAEQAMAEHLAHYAAGANDPVA